jgi:hypothetical protein
MKNIRVTIDDNIYLDILGPFLDNKKVGASTRDMITAIMKYTTWYPVIFPVRDRLRIILKQKSYEKHQVGNTQLQVRTRL